MKAIICLLILMDSVQACLWDRDTIKDELKNNTSTYDVIMGQFYHHGKAYYISRKAQYLKELETNADDLDLLNDLAVAHIRLKEFDEAKIVLRRALELNPKYYKTLSNLGVLYKKDKDYVHAVFYTKRALTIKKEGHLGLGDWYLKMLEYRVALEKEDKPTKNFLGEEYGKADWRYAWEDKSKKLLAKIKRLILLVRNDQTFADGFVVLGDALLRRGEMNLAVRCYLKAIKLEHHNTEFVQKKIEEVLKHILEARNHGKEKIKKYKAYYMKNIAIENQKLEEWQGLYTEIEEDLIQQGLEASFNQITEVMKEKKIKKFRPKK